jgi:hypothetical protein
MKQTSRDCASLADIHSARKFFRETGKKFRAGEILFATAK